MIRINLLGDRVDLSATYALQMAGYTFAMVTTVLVCIFMYGSVSTALSDAEKENKTLEKKLTKLEEQTEEVDKLEKKRSKLENKLRTIANLKAKKHGPVHFLDELNISIPERAWLLEVKEKDGNIEVDGIALDNQTIAAFMSALQKSIYFDKVDIKHSTQSELDGVKLKRFLLAANLVNPFVSKATEVAEDEEDDKKKKKGRGRRSRKKK